MSEESCVGVCEGEGGGGGTVGEVIHCLVQNVIVSELPCVGCRSLAAALSSIPWFTKAQASAFKIFQVIQNNPVINKPGESDLIPTTVEGKIELHKVDFSYPSRPDVPILRDFSLTVPPGKTVAIVGSSGSGKSTVVSLIERFYDPSAGN